MHHLVPATTPVETHAEPPLCGWFRRAACRWGRDMRSPDELLLPAPGAHACVLAQAMAFSEERGSSPGGILDVALLSVPTHDEGFVLRAPRGTFTAGALFGLRFLESGRTRLALVRALEVTRPLGASFDLVGAHLVRPAEVDHATPPGVHLEPGAQLAETTMTLVSLSVAGTQMRLLAPHGAIDAGARIALRYFDAGGARHGVLRVDSVRAQSEMLDEIQGSLVGAPTAAPQRESYRAPLDLYVNAELSADARPILARLTDVSADGVGFQADAQLDPGVRLRVQDPAMPSLHGAELAIVRRDAHEGTRHGARFVEPRRGVVVLASLLGLDRSEGASRAVDQRTP
jgi:hypothetical protein